jgi:hypothetical protein
MGDRLKDKRLFACRCQATDFRLDGCPIAQSRYSLRFGK